MLLAGSILAGFGVSAIAALSITASDLPECAVECYCYVGGETNIPITDYEGRCRSAPFQITLRSCTKENCTQEEYAFTEFHAKKYCAQFKVDLDKVLLDHHQNQAPREKETINNDKSRNGEWTVDLISAGNEVTSANKSTCPHCNTVATTELIASNTSSAAPSSSGVESYSAIALCGAYLWKYEVAILSLLIAAWLL